jgi:hypothetical protein
MERERRERGARELRERTRLERRLCHRVGNLRAFVRSKTMRDAAMRGLGGLLVASVAGQFAAHVGMPAWQIGLIVVFVAIGLPMCLSGRLGNW